MTQAPGLQRFADPGVDGVFERDGWAHLPLLHPDVVSELLLYYRTTHPAAGSGFHASMFSTDVELRRAIREKITPVVTAAIAPVLRGHRICVANFLVKEPGAVSNIVPVHQDWSFVDERVHRSVHVWCPLVDVNAENGCLDLYPQTQWLANFARAHGDAHPFANVLTDLDARCRITRPAAAGDAIFYNGALLHASGRNRTAQARISIGCVLIPNGAQLMHAFRLSATTVENFAVDDDFFLSHQPGLRPAGYPSLGVVESVLRDATRDDAASILNRT